MTENETARSLERKSKVTATVAKPAKRATAGKVASPRRPKEDVHQRIQRRAYELWENEGRPAGREQANWLQAESEIARTRAQRVGLRR